MNIETQLIHAGEEDKKYAGAVVLPVFQSATFAYGGEDKYHDQKYIRLNNTPGHKAVQEKLARIAGGEDAVVTASGMAAITTALLTVLKKRRPPAGTKLSLWRNAIFFSTHYRRLWD